VTRELCLKGNGYAISGLPSQTLSRVYQSNVAEKIKQRLLNYI